MTNEEINARLEELDWDYPPVNIALCKILLPDGALGRYEQIIIDYAHECLVLGYKLGFDNGCK